LVVEEQIEDAEYFLNILRTNYERNEMRPNLTAFLALARSILDYLLEDYNTKFGLNIQLSDRFFKQTFENEAKKQKNHSASQFIIFYKKELDVFQNNQPSKFLSEKRNIKIHRRDTPLCKEVEVNIQEIVPVIDAVDNVVTDKNGNIKQLKEQDKPSC
jgi:hypothetical protein